MTRNKYYAKTTVSFIKSPRVENFGSMVWDEFWLNSSPNHVQNYWAINRQLDIDCYLRRVFILYRSPSNP